MKANEYSNIFNKVLSKVGQGGANAIILRTGLNNAPLSLLIIYINCIGIVSPLISCEELRAVCE